MSDQSATNEPAEHIQLQQLDAEHREKMATIYESAAPIAKRGPLEALPLTLSTLKFLPPEDQQLYERAFDGSFRLAWIRQEDAATITAHIREDQSSFRILPTGQSVHEIHAAAVERNLERNRVEARVFAILDADDQAQADKQRAQLEARHAAERAEFDRARAEVLAERKAKMGAMEINRYSRS